MADESKKKAVRKEKLKQLKIRLKEKVFEHLSTVREYFSKFLFKILFRIRKVKFTTCIALLDSSSWFTAHSSYKILVHETVLDILDTINVWYKFMANSASLSIIFCISSCNEHKKIC